MVSMMPYSAVELREEATSQTFLVNGQYVKHYYNEDTSCDEEAIDLASDKYAIVKSCTTVNQVLDGRQHMVR